MDNKPFHAPIKDPKRIIDIGCGTGVMTVELAKAYPDAEVIGLDLSPVPERHEKLPNLTYIQGDVRELAKGGDERIAKGTFDYVFHRLLVLGMTDWPSYVATVASLLRPGGYAELQEIDLIGLSTSEREWFHEWIIEDSSAMGLDIQIAGKLSALMKDAGLEDVTEKIYKIPLARESSMPNAALVRNRNENSRKSTLRAVLERVCGPRRSKEELERILEAVDRRVEKERKPRDHRKMYAVVGQKPPEG